MAEQELTVSGGADRALEAEVQMWTLLQNGRFDDATALAARLLITATDPSLCGRVEAAIGIMLQRSGLMADAREQFTRALALVSQSPVEEATFLAVSSLSNVLGGDLPGAQAQAERAMSLGERNGAWFAVRQALTTISAVHLGNGEPRKALAAAKRALSLATVGEGAQAEYRSTAYVMVGMSLAELDRMAEAHTAIATGIRLADEEGDTGQLSWYLASQAMLHFVDGHWDEACREARESLRVGERTGALAPRPLAWGVWATIEGIRGDTSAARDLIARARSNRMGPYGGLGEEWVAMATAAASADRSEQYDALCEGWFRLRGVPYLLAWRIFAPPLVWAALEQGDRDVAEAVSARAREGAERSGGVASALATGLRCEAALANDPEPAEEAVLLLRDAHRPFVLGTACLEAAVLWSRRAEHQRALTLLRESSDLFHRLHATRWTALSGRLVNRIGAQAAEQRAKPTRPEGWDRLTVTERAVAKLAARGLTNPQIAAERVMSARTVQAHMSHITAKLGLTSRVQLAAYLAGHDLD